MKPFSAILTVMLAASLLLTGCSSSQTESSTPETVSYTHLDVYKRQVM